MELLPISPPERTLLEFGKPRSGCRAPFREWMPLEPLLVYCLNRHIRVSRDLPQAHQLLKDRTSHLLDILNIPDIEFLESVSGNLDIEIQFCLALKGDENIHQVAIW